MKIIKYEKKNNEKYKLYLDDGTTIDTYEDVILKNKLLYHQYLDNQTLKQIRTDTEDQELFQSCIKYISFRIRSTKEVKNYLQTKNATENQIVEIISKLQKLNLLNEDLYIQSFIKDKLNLTNMGEYKIIAKLKEQDISQEQIDKYLYLFDETILKRKINKLIEKYSKRTTTKPLPIIKNKIYQNLMNLGYDKSMIQELLTNFYSE